MKEREGQKIIDRYFRKDSNVKVYGNINAEKLNKIIQNIGNFEEPDMLSIFDDTIIGIEHFEFDSSKNTSKGSKYQIANAMVKSKFDKIVENDLKNKEDITYHDDIKVNTSLSNYYENFNKHYKSHCEKVDKYIEHIKQIIDCNNKEIEMWFFVEDTSILGSYYLDKERHIGTLLPLYNNNNLELFEKSTKICGIIIGFFAMNEYRICVIENSKEGIEKFKKDMPEIKEEDYFCFEPHTVGFATLLKQ